MFVDIINVFQDTQRRWLQHITESVEGGIPRISIVGDRHGSRHRHEFSLSTTKKHEESVKFSGTKCR